MNLQEFAERAVHIPFVERGRSWDGTDCWGLVCICYREVYGVAVPTYLDSYESTSEHRAIFEAFRSGKRLWRRIDRPGAGDLALILRRNLPIHVGVMLTADMLLHTEERVGTVIEPIDRWRVEGYYRRALDASRFR